MTIKTKGEIRISDKKKQVLDVFEKALPNMSDADIEKLLAFGEGVVEISNCLCLRLSSGRLKKAQPPKRWKLYRRLQMLLLI